MTAESRLEQLITLEQVPKPALLGAIDRATYLPPTLRHCSQLTTVRANNISFLIAPL